MLTHSAMRRHWSSLGLVVMKATVSALLGLWMAGVLR